ncbi:MAG: endonuclease/exonuclease/phosphatase family protein [Candidatus Moraniibacteriota bacterium]
MKILSWNIWVDGHFDELKSFLRSADADIIGLQEVKDDDSSRDVIGLLTGLGYSHVFARTEQIWDGKAYRHGPAVFSRLPIIHSETFLIDEADQRAAARADVMVGDTVLHILSTHLVHTHQKPSPQQESQVARLIERLPQDHVVVMGDFNATPDSVAIQMMRNVLVDTGDDSALTWSVYPEGCTVCLPQALDTRLDYIFVSEDLQADSFEVHLSAASDHLPISVNVTA